MPHIKRVHQGDPMVFPADAYNAFADARRDLKSLDSRRFKEGLAERARKLTPNIRRIVEEGAAGSVRGTFNPAAVLSMQSTPVKLAERTAKASEATAKYTKSIDKKTGDVTLAFS